MEKKITTLEEQRSAAAILVANINGMCNATTTEDVIKCFMEAKDLMIALYTFNVERVGV